MLRRRFSSFGCDALRDNSSKTRVAGTISQLGQLLRVAFWPAARLDRKAAAQVSSESALRNFKVACNKSRRALDAGRRRWHINHALGERRDKRHNNAPASEMMAAKSWASEKVGGGGALCDTSLRQRRSQTTCVVFGLAPVARLVIVFGLQPQPPLFRRNSLSTRVGPKSTQLLCSA